MPGTPTANLDSRTSANLETHHQFSSFGFRTSGVFGWLMEYGRSITANDPMSTVFSFEPVCKGRSHPIETQLDQACELPNLPNAFAGSPPNPALVVDS